MTLFSFTLLLIVAASHVANCEGKLWALLTAGSANYYNYRHQADISHAYQILIRRGVPAENIITIMVDDIAHNPKNKHPGVIINKPGGPNVYKGVKIDYKGLKEVTPKNFLAVLTGNKEAVKGIGTGRVIESGPKDEIFVNFADHGGPGVLGFPDDVLHASELISSVLAMHAKKKYKQMVFYVEACESGSVFDKILPDNVQVLATTASNATQSSWACYCSSDPNNPCLADVFSAKWMQHVDKAPKPTESLFDQFKIIKKEVADSKTNYSEPQVVSIYGDHSLYKIPAQDFYGQKNIPSKDSQHTPPCKDYVDAREAALHYIKHMAKFGSTEEERTKYTLLANEMEQKRKIIDTLFDDIVSEFSSGNEKLNDEVVNTRFQFSKDGIVCQKDLYQHFSKNCFNIAKSPYVLRHLYKLANICELPSNERNSIFSAIEKHCDHYLSELHNVE